jgi:hypothetical protein
MAQKSLFSRGPFLLGLTMVLIGLLGFAAGFFFAQSLPPDEGETKTRIGEVAGMFGGAFIGIGVVAMILGLIKCSKG